MYGHERVVGNVCRGQSAAGGVPTRPLRACHTPAQRPPTRHGFCPAADVVLRNTAGRLVAVQEQRFRLRTDDGQVVLLTLARDARLDGAKLAELYRRRARVAVAYSGQPNLTGGVAHAVREAVR